MNTILKPISFFLFIVCLIWFINIVLIFASYNTTAVFAQEAEIIIDANGNNIQKSKTEINNLKNLKYRDYNFQITELNGNSFQDTYQLIISHVYNYIGINKQQLLERKVLIVNKQL